MPSATTVQRSLFLNGYIWFLGITVEIVMVPLLAMRFCIDYLLGSSFSIPEDFYKVENGFDLCLHLLLFLNYRAKMRRGYSYIIGGIARPLVKISRYTEIVSNIRYCDGERPVIFLKNRLKCAGSLNPNSWAIS